jgi:pimeloyl-ACP methyl ester carboxylesterase
MHSTDVSAQSVVMLRDGRRLAYAEFGDPGGEPVVFMHGWCGSRTTRHPDDSLSAGLGVRLITVDRPGVGGSDRLPGRRLLDWPDDVRQLADELGLERFAVLGHSGGGPHALACAARLAERVTQVGVACGFAPMNRAAATDGMQPQMRRAVPLLRWAPWLSGPMLASLPKAYRRDPLAAWEAQFGRGLAPSDRAAFEMPSVRENILAAAVEALRNGSAGVADELPLFMGRNWGFSPSEVCVPTRLWYGQADTVVPLQMGRYLASEIAGAQLVEYPGEGHMLYVSHWRDMLLALTGAYHAEDDSKRAAAPKRTSPGL